MAENKRKKPTSGKNKNVENQDSDENGKGRDRRINGASRPSVIPLTYPDKDSLQKAYMPFVKGGGLFLPTTSGYQLNEEIFLLVTLPDSKNSLPVPGQVIWQTPAGSVDGRRQGVGIEFKGREGNALRNRIEGLLGAKVSSFNPTYTM